MNLWFVLTWSVLRTVVVASMAVWMGRGILRQIDRCVSSSWRGIWLAAALIPLLMPELVVGFTYRLTAQHLTDSVWGTELLYAIVMLARSCAVSILVQCLIPRSAVTPESVHSWRLLNAQGVFAGWVYLRLLLTGPWRNPLLAWCLTALVTFQDFETAALVQVDRHPIVWTVWLFDANAGNQILRHTLMLIAAPVVFEMLLLLPCLLLISPHDGSTGNLRPLSGVEDRGTSKFVRSPVQSWLALLATVTAGWILVGHPVALSVPELARGMAALSRDLAGVSRQQAATFGFSATAAALAMTLAVLLRRRNHSVLTCVCLAPGLAGSLALSLTLLVLFQSPGLRWLWDTWLPLLVGQSLLVLPRAWVLLLVLEFISAPEALHSARLLHEGSSDHRATASRLLWRLSRLQWLLALTVLCHWCTWDVTTASALRPVTVEPVVTRLYREMHFSRTESLTALALITATFPLLAAAAGVLVWRVTGCLRRPALRLSRFRRTHVRWFD